MPVLAGTVLAVHCTVMLAGHVSTGTTLSMTVIVWVQVCTFPTLSVTVNIRVIRRGLRRTTGSTVIGFSRADHKTIAELGNLNNVCDR